MLSALLQHGHDLRSFPQPQSGSLLECQARAVGYEQRRNEVYSWDGMARGTEPFLVIQHTTLGEGRLDYAGTQFALRPGQTMLVTMPHRHRYWLERGGQWEYFWLLLTGKEALRIAREILAHVGPVLTLDDTGAERLAGACLGLLAGGAMTPGVQSGHAYSAMTALHDGCFAGKNPTDDLPADIARVVGYIDQNLAAPLRVDHLAAFAGLSRAHFVRRFSAAVGRAPSEFVQGRRLLRIERLLLATEMSVGQIAAATGFADGNYLAKIFRKTRGLSPLEFRATRSETP